MYRKKLLLKQLRKLNKISLCGDQLVPVFCAKDIGQAEMLAFLFGAADKSEADNKFFCCGDA